MFTPTVELPDEITKAAMDHRRATSKAREKECFKPRTSIASLSPHDPVVLALQNLPIGKEVVYHSIIANHQAADTPGGTDLVVPYTSSHLEGAVSEKIIRSGHRCTSHPEAILEVRRIVVAHAAR